MRKSRRKIILILILAVMFISLVIISLPALGFLFGEQVDKWTNSGKFSKVTDTFTTERGDEFTHVYCLESMILISATYEHELYYNNKKLISFSTDKDYISYDDLSVDDWIVYKISSSIIFCKQGSHSFESMDITDISADRIELYQIYYQLLVHDYLHFEELSRVLLSVGDLYTISLVKNYAAGDFSETELNNAELTPDIKLELQEISAQLVEEYKLNGTE